MRRWLTNYFGVISFRKELLAGLTTFLTMSYIVVVNPLLLKDAGLDPGSVFVATCLISAMASIAMGLYANYPIALAPGLSMATYFSYVIVGQLGYAWQDALGAVLIAALLLLLVTVLRLRAYIIAAIPECLKIAISCGIGLFIGLIALKNAQILNVIPGKLIQWAEPLALPAIFTYLGMGIIVVLHYFRVPGALLLAIVGLTILGGFYGLTTYQGIFSLPPSIQPTWLALQMPSLWQLDYWNIILSIFFVAFFDATGTLLGLLYQAGMPTDAKDPRFAKALVVDGGAAIVGAGMGTATVGAYIENAAGIAVGGRTGFTAIIVGLLFLLALFFSPLTKTIPNFATASVLLFVAYLMLKNIRQVNWRDPAAVVSTLLTMVITPLSFSIVYGVASGFIAYLGVKLVLCQAKTISRWQWFLGFIFAGYLAAKWLNFIE
ncbi:MAG: uracil/xanthine permease family [Gammaproteobacteria bacterium]|jgi:AGZA family xanthine/uracil permease-like MFS transporter|nr:uracil/xanthine permease family [Gammaproteobacteria bacterium]